VRVLVTGGTGHIGSAVVAELLGTGYEVVGLARSDASAAKLEAAGAAARRGDLDDLDGLKEAAREADGVIQLAFKHAPGGSSHAAGAIDADLAAALAFGEALAGTGKPFVNTSGTLMLALMGLEGGAGTELDVSPGGHRADVENATIALADQGVRASVARLAPLVHSDLDTHGFGPMLIDLARAKGFAAYPGDGSNRWPAINTRDAATLYRRALESATPGTRLHGVAEEGITTRAIAEAIGRGTNLPVHSIPMDDLGDYFGYLERFIALDNPSSSTLTRDWLDWKPTHPGLLEEYAEGHYFG
jgi:nucleoside-diphosphate-sugar epimerase